MKHFPASRWAAFAIVGCLAHTAGQGATVGRAQGAVLIGRPLDVTVPLLLEGAADTAPECAESEVFYGDGKIPASNVGTELQGGSRPVVRVRSSAAVNEPVVTVYLQLGCGSRFTRKIVLLAEPDPAVDVQRPLQAATATARSEAAESAVNAAPLNLSMSRGLPAAAPASQAQPPRRKRPAASAVAPAPSRAAAQSAKPAGPAIAVAKPKTPAPAAQVQPPPATRDQLRLDAPVGVSDPAAPSEEQLRQAARLQAIERDLGEMRQFIKRNDAAMLQLQAQLARAEAERYANPLVYGLAGLLVLMAGLMVFFWRRAVVAREMAADDWWRSPRTEREAGRAAAASAGERDHDAPDVPRRPSPPVTFSVADSVPAPQVAAADLQTPTVRVPLVTSRTDDFQSSHGASRALKAEELHDVQQEADFFSSLGEYDRAIEVLRGHIQAHPETSAVAWLDLVEIYHKLGRREEFDWVRKEFRQRFNAQVPAFDDYSQESAGIEAYDHAMARIAALWPSRRVLDVIEESIFRGPSKDGSQAFSLQAYRELLLLHHIGQQVLVGGDSQRSQFGDSGPISGPHSDSSSPGFSHTSIHPLTTGLASLDEASDQRVRDHQARDSRSQESQKHQLDVLDLNLDELPVHVGAEADAHLLDFDLPDMSAPDDTQLLPTRH